MVWEGCGYEMSVRMQHTDSTPAARERWAKLEQIIEREIKISLVHTEGTSSRKQCIRLSVKATAISRWTTDLHRSNQTTPAATFACTDNNNNSNREIGVVHSMQTEVAHGAMGVGVIVEGYPIVGCEDDSSLSVIERV